MTVVQIGEQPGVDGFPAQGPSGDEVQGVLSKTPSLGDRRQDFYTLTEKGLDLIPIVLNVVLWSAKHDSKSYVRRSKAFVARLSRNPVQVGEEVKALVRNGGCLFPERKE